MIIYDIDFYIYKYFQMIMYTIIIDIVLFLIILEGLIYSFICFILVEIFHFIISYFYYIDYSYDYYTKFTYISSIILIYVCFTKYQLILINSDEIIYKKMRW